MPPLRILQVIEFFTPRMGGSVQVAYQTARHLAKRGHQVTVWSSDYGADGPGFPDTPFEVVRFHNLLSRWGLYFTPGLLLWARRNLAGFDIVHLHNLRTFQNVVVAGEANKQGIPYLLSAHGSLPWLVERRAAKRAFDRLFGRRLLRQASRLVAVSQIEAGQYAQAGIPPGQVALIPNGLDLSEFEALPRRGAFRESRGIAEDRKIILFLGRLHKIKGLEHLVEAFGRLQENRSDLLLVIAGPDEGELERIKSIANAYRLIGCISFLGGLYGIEKLSALRDANVLVYPGSYEIFGLVPFEAIMCGTPVVVAMEGASGEYLRENGGYLFPAGNVQSLVERVNHILSDPIESNKKVKKGQKFIQKRLDWNVVIKSLESEYFLCLPSHQKSRVTLETT